MNKYKIKFVVIVIYKISWAIFTLLGITTAYIIFLRLPDTTNSLLFCSVSYAMLATFIVMAVFGYAVSAIQKAFKNIHKQDEYIKKKYGINFFEHLAFGDTKVIFRHKAWSIDTKLSLVQNNYLFFEDMALMYLVIVKIDEIIGVRYYKEDNFVVVYVEYESGDEVVEDIMNFSDIKHAKVDFIAFLQSLPNSKQITKSEYNQKLSAWLKKTDKNK